MKIKCKILDKNQILNNLFLPNTIKCTLWNKIFKLNVIKKANLKFKENIYIGEDMIFLVEYIKCSENFYCFNIPLYSYLKNQQGAMGTSHIEINERHLTEWDAIKKVKEELEQFEKVQDNLFKKQILIAHKIYRSIKKTNLDNNYKIELKNFLINNLNKLFLFKDLRLKTKISIFLNIIRN